MKTHSFKPGFLIATLFLFVFLTYGQDVTEWAVPDKYKSMNNPLESNQENLKLGKMLYNKHCKSCHGTNGLGDGAKAKTLKTSCGDFSAQGFQAQADGAIFYKTTEGRDEMPSYNQKIPDDNDRWAVVLYLRSFK